MFSALKKSIQKRPSAADIQSDILAGLTVGVIALPLSMALAIASGVAPQHGLYTAMIAGIVIAITGGSKVNISGPTAAFVVVLLPIVQQFGLGGLLISGLMAGIILLCMGLAKLGKLIEVIPYPVVIGFTAGIAVVIATFQIKDFLGLSIESLPGHYLENLQLIIEKLPTIRLQECLIGLLTLVILILWPRLRTRVPGHLVALLAASVIAWLAVTINPDFSVATIGSRFYYEWHGLIGGGIPPFAPSFNWPWHLPDANGQPIGLSWNLVRALLPAAITIAVLGALESLLCAVVADGMTGKKHESNDELIGQGLGNLIIPFLGGIPATAAIARTAANVKAGAHSPLASVTHGLFILLAVLLLAPLLSYIPMAAMAALLLTVAWNMSEARHFVRTVRVAPRSDIVVLLLCFFLTVLFDMTIAVGIGMSLASILFIQKSISLTTTTKIEDTYQQYGALPKEIAIFDINGALFFGSAQKAMNSIALVSPEIRVVILDMSGVNMMDMSAIVAMESITQGLLKKGVSIVIANLQPRMISKLHKAGISQKNGDIEFADSLPEAINKAHTLCQQ